MNDLHVVALNYRVDHGAMIDYSRAEPLEREEPGFRMTVRDRKVRFELEEHYATEEQAREAIAEYIRVWEFDATLKRGNSESFRLVFETPEIIDRRPTPGRTSMAGRLTAEFSTGTPTLQVQPRAYPEPPSDIALNPDARTMHQRYLGYRGRHEPLQSVAYFCLSMLEDPPLQQSAEERRLPAKRKAAGRKFGIDEDVLAEIGHLSSSRGGQDARKATGVAMEFSPQERHFLDRALKTIIRRVAEREHTPESDLPKISWSDLPPI